MSLNPQKPERIASALYLLTSFFSDQEPAKWKLRAIATDLVSVGTSLLSQMFKERESARLELRSMLLEIKALSSMARNAGLISPQNFNVLNEELLRYMENLGFPLGLEEENGAPVLSQSFFGQREKELPTQQAPTSDIKDKKAQENLSYSHQESKRELLPSKAEQSERVQERPLKEFGAVSVKKNSRQSIIIALLKRKKEIMIKDVSPLIRECSEKTIQRELLAMVSAGILKKTGEKRWSRYSLA